MQAKYSWKKIEKEHDEKIRLITDEEVVKCLCTPNYFTARHILGKSTTAYSISEIGNIFVNNKISETVEEGIKMAELLVTWQGEDSGHSWTIPGFRRNEIRFRKERDRYRLCFETFRHVSRDPYL